MLTVGIVGGGFSGLMTAYHLFSNSESELNVLLFNHRHPTGKGIAFGTEEEIHLLNVPAGKMSALPEDPDHFVSWMRSSGYSFTSDDFVPRKIFGEYLMDLLNGIRQKHRIHIVEKEVQDIRKKDRSFSISCKGQQFDADSIVLATGNLLPESLVEFQSEHYIQDPWKFGEIEKQVEKNGNVVIVGTGLSMIDVILYLDKIGADVNVTCISSNGLLPQPHVEPKAYPVYLDELNTCRSVNDFYSVVKKHLKEAPKSGYTRQAVIDVLRPYVHEIWLRLDETDRKRFLRHLKHGWNVLRHRIPASTAEVVEKWKSSGKLTVHAGKVVHTSAAPDGIDMTIHIKGEGNRTINSCLLVNCTGPLMNYNKVRSSLYNRLFERSLATPGSLGLGLHADSDGKLLNRNNEVIERLYTLGPTMKSVLWETTAVNEIRNQAKKIAKTILIYHGLIT